MVLTFVIPRGSHPTITTMHSYPFIEMLRMICLIKHIWFYNESCIAITIINLAVFKFYIIQF